MAGADEAGARGVCWCFPAHIQGSAASAWCPGKGPRMFPTPPISQQVSFEIHFACWLSSSDRAGVAVYPVFLSPKNIASHVTNLNNFFLVEPH